MLELKQAYLTLTIPSLQMDTFIKSLSSGAYQTRQWVHTVQKRLLK